MIYLYPESNKVKEAEKVFHREMKIFVQDRIHKQLSYSGKRDIREIIEEHIDELLIAKPKRLLELHGTINEKLSRTGITEIEEDVKYILNYDIFSNKKKTKYDIYDLSQALSINTCPYCNRSYTNTVITKNGNKLTRPEFDHFFPQSQYPLLAVSFYNLIPSCKTCNSSLKGTKEFNLDEYLHPYIDNVTDNISFSYELTLANKSGLKVKVKTDDAKIENTASAFELEEIYNSHIADLEDMIKIRQYFSDRYLSILMANMSGELAISIDEAYRIVFGTEYNNEDFSNRPLSKFKKDILNELGII